MPEIENVDIIPENELQMIYDQFKGKMVLRSRIWWGDKQTFQTVRVTVFEKGML